MHYILIRQSPYMATIRINSAFPVDDVNIAENSGWRHCPFLPPELIPSSSPNQRVGNLRRIDLRCGVCMESGLVAIAETSIPGNPTSRAVPPRHPSWLELVDLDCPRDVSKTQHPWAVWTNNFRSLSVDNDVYWYETRLLLPRLTPYCPIAERVQYSIVLDRWNHAPLLGGPLPIVSLHLPRVG